MKQEFDVKRKKKEDHFEDDGSDIFENSQTMINIGPQHPATHGVLRLRIVVDPDGNLVLFAGPADGA